MAPAVLEPQRPSILRKAATVSVSKKKNFYGEPFVWLTSMGLVVGLLMIVALLGLIFWNGVSVFWPNRVVQIQTTDGKVVAGEVVTKQPKAHAAADGKHAMEWQLFMGNKDVYGLPFRYLDESAIASQAYPQSLAVIERVEYGDAIGSPASIRLANGETVLVTEAGFDGVFRTLVSESKERTEKIKQIEKVEIGKINEEMNRLQNRKKTDPDNADIAARQSVLQGEYSVLAKKARELRNLQEKPSLTYRVVSGEEKTLHFGKILGFYYPNRLGLGERIGMAFSNFFAFLVEEPREANTEGGIFPAIFGTFVMTVMMSLAVTPFGVLAAIYLREYARQGAFVRMVRIAVNNLAGVPSIVFGVFGLGFFVYFVGSSIDQLFFKAALPTPTFGTGGIFWAALTLALMTVPVVIVSTEEALAAVPRGAREGSLACGASKWQTIQRVILPAAAPGIMTGFILAMARGAGEVAPLMLVGVVKMAPSLPIDAFAPFVHLERKFMHLGFHIYDLGFQSPDSEAAKPMVFATTLVLITLVVLLNLSAIWLRQRLRRKYAIGAV